VVISPGPGKPEDAGISVAVAAACIERHKPLLGVCLGHQAIAVACGLEVGRTHPVHGKPVPIRHDGSGVFADIPDPVTVSRYHSLAIMEVAGSLTANAWSDDGIVMGIRHAEAPVHGVQFHPESIATGHGHRMLANFLSLAKTAIGA
jgi:anthranilate synthase component 2